MDITDIYTAEACEKGAEMQVINPITGKKTDCFITVMGVDSVAFRNGKRKGSRAILEAVSNASKGDDLSPIEFATTADVLAGVTTGWRGFTNKGKEFPFSNENVIALYLNSPDIANQVDIFIANRANFTKG